GGEVVAGVELRGVDEEAHDDEVVLVARGAEQRDVAAVVGAHRRHEADLAFTRGGERGAELAGGADEPHRAVASASTSYSGSSSGRVARIARRCASTVPQSPRSIGPVSSKPLS